MIDAALIRHAESLSNVGLPTELPETIPLTVRGWAQSHALAAEMDTAPALVVTSP
jgi:broad specificity phosphatase PhoE